MNLFDDIKSPVLLHLKGGLFLLLAVMAGGLTLFVDNRWQEILFLLLCVWASCRFYYFLFYVLEHYVGGEKNASVFAMFLRWRSPNHGAAAGNLFADLPTSLPEEWTNSLIAAKHIRIERIVSTGQESPPDFWYDQAEHEWVAVLKGEAELEFADPPERTRLHVGDSILIPARRKHRVAWTSPDATTVWLAVFFED